MSYDKVIFELSRPGRKGYNLPPLDVEDKGLENYIPDEFRDDNDLDFPEVSEVDVIRHYTNLSQKNFGVDTGFYPLGSCTMKYNPKINEDAARLSGFANVHPLQDVKSVQGTLDMLYNCGEALSKVAGMDYMSLQPAAGAHGEITGIAIIKAYHEDNGDTKRNKIIVPDSAHGTNPATAAMAGYKIVEIKSAEDGTVDLEALEAACGDDTAALMLTNPNTLGIYDKNIEDITRIVHDAGGLCYYDGANMNAILAQSTAGDMGFDVVHFNVHKTFSTPHGGGGPGAGPVGVKEFLKKYIPAPVIEKNEDGYFIKDDVEKSLGRMKDFYGHVHVLLRTYAYLLTMGGDGLKEASTNAVLNANYIKDSLKEFYNLPIDGICMHEFVFDNVKNDTGITTLDVAKRLLDKGFHAPTVYFPLIVHEAMMIEPTETESKQTLDEFIQALKEIHEEANSEPETLKSAPRNTIVRRPDEVKAAKDLIVTYQPE